MMQLRYHGPHDQITIDGIPGVIDRDSMFDAPDELAEHLAGREGFSLVKPTKVKE